MSIKLVRNYSEIEDKILNAVDTITNPIKQTLSPRGGNVIFEDDDGNVTVTNDGVTIAKNIAVEDPFEDSIMQIIKESALKTNTQAGDGTSTTILLSSILIKEGLRLVGDGMNQRDVVDGYRDFVAYMDKQIEKQKKQVKSDDELEAIARISANNDDQIAGDVVRVVRTAGEDGYIFLEPSHTKDTEIQEDTGFVIESGMFTPELVNTHQGTSNYQEVPVLITDKRLYYAQEAETILNTCLQNGYKEVVIVAKDFIGEALPYFVANHQQGGIRVLLVKDPNVEDTDGATLEDLAAYLDGEVIAEKHGKIVDKLEIGNFCIAKKAYADAKQTVIMRNEEDNDYRLKQRVKHIKNEIKKFGDSDNKDKKTLKKRLASLTNGIVTVRIGGSTPIEVKERRFRYEDAINAGRAAVKDGYLPGGGVAIMNAFYSGKLKTNPELYRIFQKASEANIRQIAENSGKSPQYVLDKVRTIDVKNAGYNALTDEYGDVLEMGIIDPYKVTRMAIENAVSIANAIISSRYLIVVKTDENGESRSKDTARE